LTVSDVGGGVYKAALIVDGVEETPNVLDDNGGACAKPFVHAVPCKTRVLGELSLDTTRLSDGEHTIGVAIYDATEVNRAEWGPAVVEVDNTPDSATEPIAGSAIPVSSSEAPSNAVAFSVRGKAFTSGAIRMKHGKEMVVRGQLLGVDAVPLADEPLSIYVARNWPGAAYRQTGVIRTDDAGRFKITLPSGPSRRIRIGSTSLGEVGRFVVRVPAPILLQPNSKRFRNKDELILTARLAGGPVRAGSADVAFQVRIGEKWHTFTTEAIRHDGRAVARHRFRVTFRRMIYRFRAVVVRRRGFPYESAASSAVSVRVN
jgi:hypothetical protein